MNKDCTLKTNYSSPILKSDIKVHPDLLSSMSYCLMKSGQLVRSKMDEALTPYNFISPHLGILIIIRNSESINQLQLGKELGIDKATMVKLIDALEKKEFVERIIDASDRRAKFIKITKSGIKFTEKMIKMRIKIEEDFLAPFSKNDQALIKKLLPQLLISFYNVSNSN